RTGRAGAKGRAFTFVTPEDVEAIANVEKLTGTTLPGYDMNADEAGGEESKPEPEGRESRARTPKAEKPASHEQRSRPEGGRPSTPARRSEPRKESRPKPEPKERELEDAGEPGEWNGPVPSFLSFSAF